MSAHRYLQTGGHRGRPRWSEAITTAVTAAPPPAAASEVVTAGDIYRIYFHGPAYRVLDSVWRSGGVVVGRFAADLPANHRPAGLSTLMAPRLIELCFQTAGIWELGTTGQMGLPHRVDRVALLRSPEEAEGRLHAVVRPADGGFDASVVDEAGAVFLTVEGYRTVELPGPIAEEKLATLAAAMRASD